MACDNSKAEHPGRFSTRSRRTSIWLNSERRPVRPPAILAPRIAPRLALRSAYGTVAASATAAAKPLNPCHLWLSARGKPAVRGPRGMALVPAISAAVEVLRGLGAAVGFR